MANTLGFVHVDDMLAQMTVPEFDERFAAWEMSGDGDTRLHLSWIVTTIANQMTRYLATKSSEPMPASSYMDPDQLVPKYMRPKRQKQRTITPDTENGAELLAKFLGAV